MSRAENPSCLIGAVFLLLIAAGSSPAPGSPPELPLERPVKEVEIFLRHGGRVAWSPQGDRLAFDRADADGRYDVYVMNLDGTQEKCLTCQALEFKKTNNLNPAWHPSGEYLIFQVQRKAKRLNLSVLDLASPYRALHSDLWLIRDDGLRFWRITQTEARGGAVLDPHFSHEGGQLLWSERVGTRQGRWGEWTLRVANLQIKKNPKLGKVRSYRPGDQRGYLVSHGFTPNDRGVVLSGNLEDGQSEAGMDVYLLDLTSGDLTRLTHSRRGWDEHAHFSPLAHKIAWTTNSELTPTSENGAFSASQLRDLWVMNPDGSDKERLTFFNHPASPESLEAYLGDFAWSPRGDQIAVHVIFNPENGGEGIYLIQLDESYRR